MESYKRCPDYEGIRKVYLENANFVFNPYSVRLTQNVQNLTNVHRAGI